MSQAIARMMRRLTTATFLVLLSVSSSWTLAQSPFDQVVDDASTGPLVIQRIDAHTVAHLAAAAHTPMGFIGWDDLSAKPIVNIPASGRPLRDVLDAMVSVDTRYRVDEENGVIILSAAAGLEPAMLLLDRITGGVKIENGTTADAVEAISSLVDAHGRRVGVGDTKRFSVDLPATSTIRDVLNGIVRAHGMLTWSVTRAATPDFPLIVSLHTASSGIGVGVPRHTVFSGTMTLRGPIHAPVIIESQEPFLDRLIMSERDPFFRVSPLSASFVTQLATAVRAPMGVEVAAVDRARQVFPETLLDGVRLREALSLISAAQPEYEWREMGGTIVFRPRAAWVEADNPLFRASVDS